MGSLETVVSSRAIEQLRKVASRLLKLAGGHSFSNLEVERFVYDLQQLESRLKGREYARTSFKPRSVMSIPERTEELFKDLEFYASMGRIWEGLISRSLDSSAHIVAEVGCGPVPKVGIGLHYSGYSGMCHLLDLDPKAGRMSCEYLTMLGARFRCEAVARSVLSASPVQYDGLFANHLIDDLVLQAYCEKVGICVTDLYNDEELYRCVWSGAVRESEMITTLLQRFARAITSLVRPGGVVLLLDYPSFSHRALGLDCVIECVRMCQAILKEQIQALGGVPLPEVLPHTLTADRIVLMPENLLVFRKLQGEV